MDPSACMLSRVRLFMTLWTIGPPGSSVCEFSRQKILEQVVILAPGDLPDPGVEPASLASPVLAGRFFTTAPPGKPRGIPKEGAKDTIFPRFRIILKDSPTKEKLFPES